MIRIHRKIITSRNNLANSDPGNNNYLCLQILTRYGILNRISSPSVYAKLGRYDRMLYTSLCNMSLVVDH